MSANADGPVFVIAIGFPSHSFTPASEHTHTHHVSPPSAAFRAATTMQLNRAVPCVVLMALMLVTFSPKSDVRLSQATVVPKPLAAATASVGSRRGRYLPAYTPPHAAVLCKQLSLWRARPQEPSELNCSGILRVTEANQDSVMPPRAFAAVDTGGMASSRHRVFGILHDRVNASNICVHEEIGLSMFRPVRKSITVNDDWSHALVTIYDMAQPPTVAAFAPAHIRAVVMPVTYGTLGNLAHTLFRTAAARLTATDELGLPPDVPAAELREALRNRYHFVVYVTTAKYGGGGESKIPPVASIPHLARVIGFNRFSESLGGNWSVSYNRRARHHVNFSVSIHSPRDEPAVAVAPAANVCFSSAIIGYSPMSMYHAKTSSAWSALAATARGVVDGMSAAARQRTWRSTTACRNGDGESLVMSCRNFCLIQRQGRSRRFGDLETVLAQVESAIQSAYGTKDSAGAAIPAASPPSQPVEPPLRRNVSRSGAVGWTISVHAFEQDESFEHQIEFARSCTVFMGIHGAALTHAAFAERGTLTVDVQGPRQAGRPLIAGLDHSDNRDTAYGALARVGGGHHLGVPLAEEDVVRLQGLDRLEFDVGRLPAAAVDAIAHAIAALEKSEEWKSVIPKNNSLNAFLW
jgi:hypothetical protein